MGFRDQVSIDIDVMGLNVLLAWKARVVLPGNVGGIKFYGTLPYSARREITFSRVTW